MMNPTIIIQPMTAKDIPICVEIMTENELWKLYGISSENAEKLFTSALSGKANLIVAKLDGQTAGFAWCVINGAWDRSAYLRLIGVLPSFQGLGVGESLLHAVEEFAMRHVKDIFLLVTHSNTSAQHFYSRLGYIQVGAIPNYVIDGITELVFYKKLINIQ